MHKRAGVSEQLFVLCKTTFVTFTTVSKDIFEEDILQDEVLSEKQNLTIAGILDIFVLLIELRIVLMPSMNS